MRTKPEEGTDEELSKAIEKFDIERLNIDELQIGVIWAKMNKLIEFSIEPKTFENTYKDGN